MMAVGETESSRVHPVAVFIGPMSSGKSKLGKAVAKILGLPFTDTDKVVVSEHGPIPEIFRDHGEDVFRQWEREAVTRALATPGIVSLGGGAVLNTATQEDLAGLRVIYLHVTKDALMSHLKIDSRPLLTDGIESWSRIFEQRRPLYEKLATVDFDTSSGHVGRLSQSIAEWIRGHREDA